MVCGTWGAALVGCSADCKGSGTVCGGRSKVVGV